LKSAVLKQQRTLR